MSHPELPPTSEATRRRAGRLATALTLGLLTLAPRPADARPVFTTWLRTYAAKNDTGSSSIPRPIIDRPLCHSGSETTDEFLDKPFTHALREQSNYIILTQNSQSVFVAAMVALDEQQHDSDCDGYPDLDEIRANFSPNLAENHPAGPPPLVPCSEKPPEPPPAPPPEPPGDDDDDDDDKNSVTPTAKPATNDGGGCAISSTGRPLDLSALLLAGLVALPLTRRALRPRKRHPNL